MVEVSPRAGVEDPPRGVLFNLQGLRALAAFMVVFVHLEAFAERLGLPQSLFAAGNAGVDLFFVISGFIMVFTTAARPTTPRGFMGQRLARIGPLYWLVTLAVFAIAMVAPELMQATREDGGELLKSLAFIPFVKANGLTQPVAFVGWTLNYEMAFYALFAVGLFAPHRRIGVFLTGAVIVLMVAAGVALRPANPVIAFYVQPIMLEFVFGMALGLSYRRLPGGRAAARAAGIVAPLLFMLLLAGPFFWPQVDRAVAFGLPALGIVGALLVLERSGVKVRNGLAQRLGDASYAVYLTHFFVTQAAIKATGALGLTSPAWTIAAIGLTLVAVALVGMAVHLLIERPIAGALRRRRRPAVVAPVKEAPCASA